MVLSCPQTQSAKINREPGLGPLGVVEGNSKDLDHGFSVDVVIVPLQLVQIGGVRGTKHVHDLRQCETCA